MEDVKQMVTQVLDSRGVISRLKAELRANVFMAINDHDVASDGHGLSKRSDNSNRTQLMKTADGQLLAQLVKEYIDWNGLAFTGQVYNVEVGLDQAPLERLQLSSRLSLGEDPSKGPLLLQLLQQYMSGGLTAQQQPAWAAKQPLPASSKGAAGGEPLQRLAAKQAPLLSQGSHHEEEGGLIGTSIYDTLTGSLRKEVSQHSSGSSSARSSIHPIAEEHSLPAAASSAASSRRISAHDSGSGATTTAASSRRQSSTQRSLSGELDLPDSSSSGAPPAARPETSGHGAAVAAPAPAALAPLPAPRVPPRLNPLGPLKPLVGRLAPVTAEPSPRLRTSDQLREELFQAGLLSPRPSAEPNAFSSRSPSPLQQPQAAAAAAGSRAVYADGDSDFEEDEGLLAAAAQVLGLPSGGSTAAAGGADLEVSSVSEEVLDIPEDIEVGGQDLDENYSGLFAAQGPAPGDTGAAAAELDALHLQLEESEDEGMSAGEGQGAAEALGLPSADASLQLQASGLQLVDRSGGLEELLLDADFMEDAM